MLRIRRLSTLQRDWRRPAGAGPSRRPWEALGIPWPTGNFWKTASDPRFRICTREQMETGTGRSDDQPQFPIETRVISAVFRVGFWGTRRIYRGGSCAADPAAFDPPAGRASPRRRGAVRAAPVPLGSPWPTGNFSNTRPKPPFPILYTEGNVNGTWAKKRPHKTIAHFPLKRVL